MNLKSSIKNGSITFLFKITGDPTFQFEMVKYFPLPCLSSLIVTENFARKVSGWSVH